MLVWAKLSESTVKNYERVISHGRRTALMNNEWHKSFAENVFSRAPVFYGAHSLKFKHVVRRPETNGSCRPRKIVPRTPGRHVVRERPENRSERVRVFVYFQIVFVGNESGFNERRGFFCFFFLFQTFAIVGRDFTAIRETATLARGRA